MIRYGVRTKPLTAALELSNTITNVLC